MDGILVQAELLLRDVVMVEGLWFCAFKTAPLASELLVSMGPSFHLWFCAFTTATLASELLVNMGPSPHLCLLHAKQRL